MVKRDRTSHSKKIQALREATRDLDADIIALIAQTNDLYHCRPSH